MTKYGIYFSNEAYYGLDFYWDTYVSSLFGNIQPCKEQIIKCLEDNVDTVTEFIRPSELFDFIKVLQDASTGDELYNNLCINLDFVSEVCKKAGKISNDFYSNVWHTIWGESISYDTENNCHLKLFRTGDEKYRYDKGNGLNLSYLLKSKDAFVEIFKSQLAIVNKDAFNILFNGLSAEDIIRKDVEIQINELNKSKEYYIKQIKSIDDGINIQLKRLEQLKIKENS